MPRGARRHVSESSPTVQIPFRSELSEAPTRAGCRASAVFPGAGQWFQGRRRQATPLLVLSAVGLLATIGAIWLLNRRGPVYILEVAMRPGALAAIFVLNALFMARPRLGGSRRLPGRTAARHPWRRRSWGGRCGTGRIAPPCDWRWGGAGSPSCHHRLPTTGEEVNGHRRHRHGGRASVSPFSSWAPSGTGGVPARQVTL